MDYNGNEYASLNHKTKIYSNLIKLNANTHTHTPTRAHWQNHFYKYHKQWHVWKGIARIAFCFWNEYSLHLECSVVLSVFWLWIKNFVMPIITPDFILYCAVPRHYARNMQNVDAWDEQKKGKKRKTKCARTQSDPSWKVPEHTFILRVIFILSSFWCKFYFSINTFGAQFFCSSFYSFHISVALSCIMEVSHLFKHNGIAISSFRKYKRSARLIFFSLVFFHRCCANNSWKQLNNETGFAQRSCTLYNAQWTLPEIYASLQQQ